MNSRLKPLIAIILVLGVFIVLNDAVINILANASSFLRKDNRQELMKETYERRIEELEKEIFSYEESFDNLKIYEGSSYILGKIALRNIYDIYDYLTIHTESKVNVGDVVKNEDGFVGLITEAGLTTAKVNLLTSGTKISVKVGEVYGIIDEYDKEKNELIVHNIDNYKTCEVGSKVMTSGFQSIKADIPIGEVVHVENKGIEKIVRVKPYVDFDNLNYLVVEAK